MRLALSISVAGVLAGLSSAPDALAQPGAQPGAAPTRCDVQIVRAPDDVKARIVARVRREPRCETKLVVRVVPTTAGFYLLAHATSGRAYEMIVPDAETAADLIAVWSARHEDGPVSAPSPIVAPPPIEAMVLAPPAIAPPPVDARPAEAGVASDPAIYAVPRVRPPGVTPETEPGAPVAAARAGAWLSVGATLGDDVQGVRGELDLWSKGGWAGGIALGYSAMGLAFEEPQVASVDFRDLRAVVTLGHTVGRGALRLRARVGVGVVKTDLAGFVQSGLGAFEYSAVSPIGEAGVELMAAFGKGRAWALTGGPMLSIYAQTYQIDTPVMTTSLQRDLDVSFVGALRRRL